MNFDWGNLDYIRDLEEGDELDLRRNSMEANLIQMDELSKSAGYTWIEFRTLVKLYFVKLKDLKYNYS